MTSCRSTLGLDSSVSLSGSTSFRALESVAVDQKILTGGEVRRVESEAAVAEPPPPLLASPVMGMVPPQAKEADERSPSIDSLNWRQACKCTLL